MIKLKRFWQAAMALVFLSSTGGIVTADEGKAVGNEKNKETLRQLPASYWKNKLDPNVYQVTRCSATEPAFSGKYWNNHQPGTYKCSNCGAILFQSKDKFDSGTGWPSFSAAQSNAVDTKVDKSFGMNREEVVCKHCGAHLGHLFPDGPAPTGQRFCINSAALGFVDQKSGKAEEGNAKASAQSAKAAH